MAITVALAMLTLVRGAMGGTETYARALTRHLDPERVDATAYVPRGAGGFSGGIDEIEIPEITPGASNLQRLAMTGRGLLLGRQIRARMRPAQVVHFPFTTAIPTMPSSVGRIVTVHDVQHLDLPHNFSHLERLYRRATYEAMAKAADLVITDSEFARHSIIDHLGVAPEKVRSIHLGFDASGFTPSDAPRENVLLYPARPYAHKNHRTLIDAVALLRRDDRDLRLVLTGEGLERLGEVPDWVDRRGLITFDELKRLYQTSRLMVFPSLYEGFGLPPLEAMASGCPVAASSAGSIPEVVGDGAELFDPATPESVADGIRRALGHTEELTARGLARAASFGGWDRCIRAHEDAYVEVAARKI